MKMTILRELWIWMKDAVWFLRISSPRVPTRRNVYRGSCKSKDFMAFLFCKPWMHGFCTVFARSVLSMSDDVGRCIALQSVPFFASGEQGQAELCLHFRVGILQQFQKSRHGGWSFALRLIGETLLRWRVSCTERSSLNAKQTKPICTVWSVLS